MCTFMAGATSLGAGHASSVVLTTSSARPLAILAMTLAVAGHTRARSAHSASSMCGMGEVSSSKRSSVTRWPERASKVRGPTSLVADSLMQTRTSTPCF